jgi:hypothetical protein
MQVVCRESQHIISGIIHVSQHSDQLLPFTISRLLHFGAKDSCCCIVVGPSLVLLAFNLSVADTWIIRVELKTLPLEVLAEHSIPKQSCHKHTIQGSKDLKV